MIPNKNRFSNQKGIGYLEVLLGISTLALTFIANSSMISYQFKTSQNMDFVISANLLKKNLSEIIKNPLVMNGLLVTSTLSDGSVINSSPTTNKAMRCILDFKSSTKTNTIPCTNKQPPIIPSSDCLRPEDPDFEKLCWIRTELSDSIAHVLPHPDPAKNTPGSLLIDNRVGTYGLTNDFQICKSFGLGAVTNCPFRVEMYIWVECDGGLPTCGATTPNGGIIKIAAVIFADPSIENFDPAKYALTDWEIGVL